MKKLWRNEWSYHTIFLILTMMVLFLNKNGMGDSFDWLVTYVIEGERSTVINFGWIAVRILYQFLDEVIYIVFGAMLVKKCFIYWVEKENCGREFLQFLPISQRERMKFHICVDIITVVVCVFVYSILQYYMYMSAFEKQQIVISWLGQAFVGMTLVIVSYIIMLLGLVYFIENFFVNGALRIFGIGSIFLMFYMISEKVFKVFAQNKLIQIVYGFFSRESVAGCYYVKVQGSNDNIWHYSWIHDKLNPIVSYKGVVVDFSNKGWSDEVYKEVYIEINRLYDFTNVSSYIFHMIGYLAIGIILTGIAIWLSEKRELSKEGFYFDFGRYLFSGLIAITFYVILADSQWKIWYQIWIVVAAIVIFVLLVYFMSSERQSLLKKKMS